MSRTRQARHRQNYLVMLLQMCFYRKSSLSSGDENKLLNETLVEVKSTIIWESRVDIHSNYNKEKIVGHLIFISALSCFSLHKKRIHAPNLIKKSLTDPLFWRCLLSCWGKVVRIELRCHAVSFLGSFYIYINKYMCVLEWHFLHFSMLV